MRTAIIFVCAAAFAAAAVAECDFPYYPEYADRISQYDIVSPLLAKKFALEHPHPYAGARSVLCEPLLVRDIEGAPFFYSVTFYNGGDDNVAKKWNEVVAIFQSTAKSSARELAEKISFFGAEDVSGEFYSMTISAYTFGTGPYKMYSGIPYTVRGYETAYAKAQKELGAEDIYFSRLIGASYVENQIFEFENGSGEKVAVHVTLNLRSQFEAVIADLQGNAAQAKGVAKGWYDFLVSEPDSANKRRVKWEEIDRKIPDETVEGDQPTLYDAINKSSGQMDTFYSFCVDEVPDPIQGASLCWSMACAALWTFHPQHGGPRFIGAPEPGHFGESGFAGKQTDDYCSWVDGEFFEFAKGLAEAVEEGVGRLEDQQNDDGGWPWWKGGLTSPYMTAYVLDGLYAIRDNPFASETAAAKVVAMIDAASPYLRGYLADLKDNGDRYDRELSLYVADVALRHGLVPPDDEVLKGILGYYFESRDPLSDRGLVLLGSVAYYMADEAKLAAVLRNLDNGAQVGPDRTLHWGDDPRNCWR